MTTKRESEKAEAWESIESALKECGPDGASTLVITELESRPSSSGRTHYLEVRVWSNENGRPGPTFWLTRNLATAMGYTFNERREAISMGGYGYCRATRIASDLTRKCGFPLYIETLNSFAGPRGWYPKAPEVARKAG